MLGCRTPEYLQYYEILTFEFLAEKFISSTFAAVALNINPLWERRILIIFFMQLASEILYLLTSRRTHFYNNEYFLEEELNIYTLY